MTFDSTLSWCLQRGTVEDLPDVNGNSDYWEWEANNFLLSEDPQTLALLFQYDDARCTLRVLDCCLNLIEKHLALPQALQALRNLCEQSEAQYYLATDGEANFLRRFHAFQGFMFEACRLLLLRFCTKSNGYGYPTLKYLATSKSDQDLLSACSTAVLLLDLSGVLLSRFHEPHNPLVDDPKSINSLEPYYNGLVKGNERNRLELIDFINQTSVDVPRAYTFMIRSLEYQPPEDHLIVLSNVDEVLQSLTCNQEETELIEEGIKKLKQTISDLLQVNVYDYGSSYTGLKASLSDWDSCILMQDLLMTESGRNILRQQVVYDYEIANLSLPQHQHSDQMTARACSLAGEQLNKLLKHEYILKCVSHARKPLVNITSIQPSLSNPKKPLVNLDLCFSRSIEGICNSTLLRHYAAMDPRFPQLVQIIKTWSKRRHINGTFHGHLSSYAYTLTVLNYLIYEGILENIQMPEAVAEQLGYKRQFKIDDESLSQLPKSMKMEVPWASFKSTDHRPLDDLILGYFKFMLFDYDWNSCVISPRCAPAVLDKVTWLDRCNPRSYAPAVAAKKRKNDIPLPAVKFPTSKLFNECHQKDYPVQLGQWQYNHPAHNMAKYLYEAENFKYMSCITIECPTENQRLLQPRYDGNWHLFAEMYRAWAILLYTNDLSRVMSPFPSNSCGSQSLTLRNKTWTVTNASIALLKEPNGLPNIIDQLELQEQRLTLNSSDQFKQVFHNTNLNLKKLVKNRKKKEAVLEEYMAKKRSLEAEAEQARDTIRLYEDIGKPAPKHLLAAIEDYEEFMQQPAPEMDNDSLCDHGDAQGWISSPEGTPTRGGQWPSSPDVAPKKVMTPSGSILNDAAGDAGMTESDSDYVEHRISGVLTLGGPNSEPVVPKQEFDERNSKSAKTLQMLATLVTRDGEIDVEKLEALLHVLRSTVQSAPTKTPPAASAEEQTYLPARPTRYNAQSEMASSNTAKRRKSKKARRG